MTLKEQMADRMAERPDAATLAWWRDQFAEQVKATRGLTHAAGLVIAETEDQNEALKDMNSRINVQAEALFEANVAIAKLQAEVTDLQESMAKAREVFSELKRKEAQ